MMGPSRGPVKHIAFAHRKLSYGGGERVLLEQVAALAELPVRVSILFAKEPDRRDIEPELRDRHPRIEGVHHLPSAWGFARWMVRERPDLLVLCNHKGAQRALPWMARLGRYRVPTVVTLHEHYDRHLRKYRGISPWVDQWIITWPFEAAVRQLLGPQPCPIIHPIYPRSTADRPRPEALQAARRALGLPEEALVVGYVGQIDGRKDPLAVLALAEALEVRLGRPIHLIFGGREEATTARNLDKALAASPLGPRTLRLGALPAVGPVLDALDLYVMASRNEGFFPIALIEALERGIPIVAPSVGGIATVLQDGRGDFLLEKPDDRQAVPHALLESAAHRIAQCLDTPGAWSRLQDEAQALARRLTEGYDAADRFRKVVAPWLGDAP